MHKTHQINPSMDINTALLDCKAGDTLFLADGIYNQKVIVDIPSIKIVGQSQANTIITFDDYACKIHADGKEFNTFRTATFYVLADNVTLANITIKNTADNPAKKGQAVALYLYGNDITVQNCTLQSMQDTLFCGPLPDDLVVRYMDFLPHNKRYYEGTAFQHLKDCTIYGSVDFIFGCAKALFERCKIVSVYDGREIGFVAAPAHSLKQKHGFLFYDCDFEGTVTKQSVFLARAWRDFGKADFVDCRLGDHINPALFDKWNDTQRDKTARFGYHGLQSSSQLCPVSFSQPLTSAQVQALLHAFTQKTSC